MPFEGTEKEIRDRLVAIIMQAAPATKAWNRFRIAKSDGEYKAWYVQEDKNINVWFVRRVALRVKKTETFDVESETHFYECRYVRGIADSDTDGEDSENIFQQQFEDVRGLIEASKDLGLDSCQISHTGLEILTPISFNEAVMGIAAAHLAIGTIAVTIANPEYEE